MIKTEKNILMAFILNLSFSVFELFGGLFTNSIAIMSDAIHDFGDAISIGLSFFLEKKSKKSPNNRYTYGYARYSILGAFITTSILTIGSCFVIYRSIYRIIDPVKVNYDGMFLLAVFGVVVNFMAAFLTKEGDSINQKSVNLHMLEDVLGWITVLIGSILMHFTDITLIDPIMSIGVALFILIHSVRNFATILDLFLEKVPKGLEIDEITDSINKIFGVKDVHHFHLWSMDGENNFATMHIKTDNDNIIQLKTEIRKRLAEYGINHVTIEIESVKYKCKDKECLIKHDIEFHQH